MTTARRLLAPLLLLLASIALGLATQMAPLRTLDETLSHWAAAGAAGHGLPFWIALTLLGYPLPVLVWLLALSARFWKTHRAVVAQLWCATLASALMVELLKAAFARPRPEPMLFAAGGFSYPSGHAAVATALYAFSAWLFLRHGPRSLAWPVAALALGIATSRILLNVHYLSDVIGGVLVGLTAVLCARALIAQGGRP